MENEDDHQPLDLYAINGCPGCMIAKATLKEGIESGDINVIDVTDDAKLAEQLTEEFGGVPVLIVHEDDKICELDIETGDVKKCIIDFMKKNE